MHLHCQEFVLMKICLEVFVIVFKCSLHAKAELASYSSRCQPSSALDVCGQCNSFKMLFILSEF